MFQFLKPLKIIPQIKPYFLIFIATNILAGQLGIIISFFIYSLKYNLSIIQILAINLGSSNLYTFSIAILASSIAPFFIEYLSQDNVKFKAYKIMSVVIMIFLLMIPMTFLSSINSYGFMKLEQSSNFEINIDYWQLIFYIASIILCIYVFCVNYLIYDFESYSDLDDSNVNMLKKIVSKAKKDSRGNKL